MDDSNNKEGNKNERDKKEDEKNDKQQQQQQKREGYFIVRNQWGQNWGMNGYAYLSLGSNTCGILNDMTHAYME
jgi:C1A family cysteine protease